MQVLGKWLPLVAATCSSIKTMYCAASRKYTCVYNITAVYMWWYLKKKHFTLCTVSVSSQASDIDFVLKDLDMFSSDGGGGGRHPSSPQRLG